MRDRDGIDIVTSSRVKCSACREAIAKGEHRFVEKVVNPFPFGDEEYSLLSYHLKCAAEQRPSKLSSIFAKYKQKEELANRDEIAATIKAARPKQLLERVLYANRAPTGRAKCDHCALLIEEDTLRLVVALDNPLHKGTVFVHAACAKAYVMTDIGLAARLKATSSKLSKADWTELRRLLG